MLWRLPPIDPGKGGNGFEVPLVVGHERIAASHGMACDQAVQNNIVTIKPGFLQRYFRVLSDAAQAARICLRMVGVRSFKYSSRGNAASSCSVKSPIFFLPAGLWGRAAWTPDMLALDDVPSADETSGVEAPNETLLASADAQSTPPSGDTPQETAVDAAPMEPNA